MDPTGTFVLAGYTEGYYDQGEPSFAEMSTEGTEAILEIDIGSIGVLKKV